MIGYSSVTSGAQLCRFIFSRPSMRPLRQDRVNARLPDLVPPVTDKLDLKSSIGSVR
jgi:hypothetical protein